MATLEDDELLTLLKKLIGSRGGDINDFDQEYVEPTANENYGYVNKPGALSFLGMAPIPGAKMAAAAVNSGINMGNNQAIRRAREALGLSNQKPSIAKDMISSPKDGKIADVQIAGQDYPVGFEAQDKDKKTTLTPNEARMRGMMNGGMTEKKSAPTPDKKQGVFGKVKDAVFGKKDDMDEDTKSLHSGLGLTMDDTGNFRHIDDPDLPDRKMADVNYDLEGKGRSEIPSSGIGNKVSDVVTDVLGAGYGVNVTSGQEPEGRSPVGTQYRHPLGFAADLQITDPDGRKLSLDNPEDKAAIESVAQGMAARYNANFGMGPEYMGNNTMHIDTMDLNKYRGGAQWASTGKEWANTLDEARATGVMPSQYYDIDNPPVPGQRPEEPSNLIAEQDEPTESPAQESLGFMGREVPQEKERSPVPSYDSLMGEQPRAQVSPDRFKNITDEEKSLMGMTLAGEIDPSKTDLSTEAGRREAMGILSTIENRAPQYGGIEGAISAPKQYSTWNNDAAANTAVSNYNGNKSTYDTLVSDFMSNPANNLGFTSYHANTVNPGWSDAMQSKETIGPHTFGFLGDQTSKEPVSTPTPHTVFNTSASYAPHMNGMVSEVNAKPSETSKPSVSSEPTETRTSDRGFSGGTGGSSSNSGWGGAGTTRSGMTGTSNNAGKSKDDNISGGFSGGRSY
ncbi:hypothetical protein F67_I3_11_102 [Rhizobium phage RHph_I3_11]|nr:hypothetical protein F67_I3_11_102 [Rhizobium phage RHph_I3_11]